MSTLPLVRLPTMRSRDEVLRTMTAVARSAAPIFQAGFGTGIDGYSTSERCSAITKHDPVLERHLREHLASLYPHIPFIGEESTGKGEDLSLLRDLPESFVVDPIDGTLAYGEGRHGCTIEMAYCEYGVPVVGVSYQASKGRIYRSTDAFHGQGHEHAIEPHMQWLKVNGGQSMYIRTPNQPRVTNRDSTLAIEVTAARSDWVSPLQKRIGAEIDAEFQNMIDPLTGETVLLPYTHASGLRFTKIATGWPMRHGEFVDSHQREDLRHKAPADAFIHYANTAFPWDMFAGLANARNAGCVIANIVETNKGLRVVDPSQGFDYLNMNFIVANSRQVFDFVSDAVESASRRATMAMSRESAASADLGRALV